MAFSLWALHSAYAKDWHKDFALRDYMHIYDFPSEQLNQPVTFPA
tara:strand:+ start:172 stop:306 length:135 start_codon:yes stop_codon:yes gene_type:complete